MTPLKFTPVRLPSGRIRLCQGGHSITAEEVPECRECGCRLVWGIGYSGRRSRHMHVTNDGVPHGGDGEITYRILICEDCLLRYQVLEKMHDMVLG